MEILKLKRNQYWGQREIIEIKIIVFYTVNPYSIHSTTRGDLLGRKRPEVSLEHCLV